MSKELFFALWEEECAEAEDEGREPNEDATYARMTDALADAADMARKRRMGE